MLNLASLFEGLAKPATSGDGTRRFSAHPLPEYERHRIAKDQDGRPALLIAATDNQHQAPTIAIHLEHLEVLSISQCIITRSDNSQEVGQFSIIRCTGNNIVLHSYFINIMEGFIVATGPNPSATDIYQAISNLVELFRAMTQPAKKTVQGFWAELFLIARSAQPELLVKAWHVDPTDVYDFNSGNQRIEVKSTNGKVRQHHFSLNQLQEPEGSKVVVASILTERTGGGVSVKELVDTIRESISKFPGLLLKLDHVVVLTLGESWRRAFEERFDFELASSSLRFVAASAIPSVGLEVPPTVTHINFKADISGVVEIKRTQLRAAGELFRAALPK